jgi:4-hydroxybenzoate polyprenyltransferase
VKSPFKREWLDKVVYFLTDLESGRIMALEGIRNKLRVFGEMIKFEHTIFALPFAYLGAFMAQVYTDGGRIPSGIKLLWITLAMVGARTAAMSLNRLIDRHIDALNPRTKDRAIPKGLLSVFEVWVYIILSFGLLGFAAWQLNPLSLKLMPIAVFFLVLYSYMKRISWLCHIVLGISLGLAPIGAWVGVRGTLDLPPILLGIAVTFWSAGFDVYYSCQDVDFDVKAGLHSIPSHFGVKSSLLIAGLFHLITSIFLVAVAFTMALGWFYLLGVLVAIAILLYEHSLVKPGDLSKLNAAFFNMNGILSVIMFIFTLADILMPSQIF